jgi:amidase
MISPTPNHVFVEKLQLGGHGLRVGVKDTIDVAGYPTRAGSRALSDAPPAARHATVVQRLLDAGCRIVGKTNLHELAFGVTGVNSWSGTPINPRYPDLVPGGSSSGSAVAVAAELVDFAIGTDTGGSVRVPAVCCGIYGLKPTYGRVSREGVYPLASSLDCVGLFARDLSMLERAMISIDPTFQPEGAPSMVSLGVVSVSAEPDISTAFRAALAAANVSVRSVSLPSFEQAYAAGMTLIGAEQWAAFGHLTDSSGLGADVRGRLLATREISRESLVLAEECRTRFQAEVDAALQGVDALALPTLPAVPPTLTAAADLKSALRMTALVRPFNVSGHPALTVPLQTDAGRPAGLQLVGRQYADAALCAVARRLVSHSRHDPSLREPLCN